jgi:hypothetical protein
VAESLVDGIVAPLFWAVIGGAPGALLYRTANTLDSMVGHRTPAYEKFGKLSARIDDLLNWVPARLCALMICLSRIPGSWRKVGREAAAHASPNAGWPEAAMAYALGVRLGGTNYYDGAPVQGPIFNGSGRTTAISDIRNSLTRIWWVVFATGGIFLMVASVPSYLTSVTGPRASSRNEQNDGVRLTMKSIKRNPDSGAIVWRYVSPSPGRDRVLAISRYRGRAPFVIGGGSTSLGQGMSSRRAGTRALPDLRAATNTPVLQYSARLESRTRTRTKRLFVARRNP